MYLLYQSEENKYVGEWCAGKCVVTKDIETVDNLEEYDKKIKLCPLLCRKRSLIVMNDNTDYVYGILETKLDDETLNKIRDAVRDVYNYYDMLFVSIVLSVDDSAKFIEIDNGAEEWYI